MNVLVDSSVWIDYLRGRGESGIIDALIDEDLLVTNDLILTELVPPLALRKQRRLISMLRAVKRFNMNVDWDGITVMRTACLKHGINGIGIPDLLIAQNAIQNGLTLLTRDRHFTVLANYTGLVLYRI